MKGFSPALSKLTAAVRQALGGPVPRLQVAALPWRPVEGGGVEVLVTTSLSSRRWILPKGNPEGDPSLAAAAARESYEETGVLGPVEGEPLGAYHYERSRLGQRFKVYVFPQQVTERHDRFPEQGQRHSRWVEPQTAAEMVEEPELAHLLRIFAANPPKIG